MDILTRADLDGLTSCVLLTLVEDIGEIKFAHPKDAQDGKIKVTENDIVVNMPYIPGCGMWFDHHISQESKATEVGEFKGAFGQTPSCASLIADYYKDEKFADFEEMIKETDRLDSATLEPEDVTDPKGWILLGYTLDARSGFGPEFQKYFRWLVEFVKELPLDKVLENWEVKRRCDRIGTERDEFKKLLDKHVRLEKNVIISDFRGVRAPSVGNRFLVYTMFPEGNVEIRMHDGKGGETVNAAIGKSIFNRTCMTNVGMLCHEYGGGGHQGAGTVQLETATSDEKLKEIINRLQMAG